jgi:hypothetical protein
MNLADRHITRLALLCALLLALGLIATRAFLSPGMLHLAGGTALLLEAAGMLILYVPLVVAGTRRNSRFSPQLLGRTTALGLVAAGIQLVHMCSERFPGVFGRWQGAAILAFMLATFSIWGNCGLPGETIR